MDIRLLTRGDYNQWLPLWQDNCAHLVADDVTAETWRRLTHIKESIFGLGVFDGDQNLRGLLHYVLHPVTGFKEPACYMQDLYIAPDYRRQGLAKRLVWELHGMGKQEKWARIYWFADRQNEAVQNLYKNLGIHMDFSLHMLLTQE